MGDSEESADQFKGAVLTELFVYSLSLPLSAMFKDFFSVAAACLCLPVVCICVRVEGINSDISGLDFCKFEFYHLFFCSAKIII